MTVREQIVTVRIKYDDQEEDTCTSQEQCCGIGKCESGREAPSDAIPTQLACCYGFIECEVLQYTEPREVLTEHSFQE